jgi:hypothetical protein
MKKIFITLIFYCLYSHTVFGQLTLQKVNSKKIVTIPNGSEISLRFPIKTSKPESDAYVQYNGRLVRASKDSVGIVLKDEVRIYTDDYGTEKTILQRYMYPKDREISNLINTNNVLFIKKKSTSRDALKNFGGVVMLLSAFHQLFLTPLYGSEFRKTSDRISLGTFGVGLTFALLPSTKTYHFKQPKNGGKSLWQL